MSTGRNFFSNKNIKRGRNFHIFSGSEYDVKYYKNHKCNICKKNGNIKHLIVYQYGNGNYTGTDAICICFNEKCHAYALFMCGLA